MFDNLQIYSGALVNEASAVSHSLNNAGDDTESFGDFDKAMANARNKAEELVREAEEEAERILCEAREKAEQEAEQLIADQVNAAQQAFHSGIWSSRHILSEIVETALKRIIGRIGKGDAALGAIEVAIQDHLDQSKLTIHVASDSHDRLRLAMLGRNAKGFLPGNVEIREDARLQAGRCVLDTGESRHEIGVDAQIAAFTKVTRETLRSLPTASSQTRG